ncbi:MAG TPA: hypothetical protein VFW23_13910 [Tepidisphaeraceae bacterium]|nr:hypothetical protein [Tepidisphaeraceae bacterium]
MKYTLRNIPLAVDRALRQRARNERRSLNDVAIEALARGMGLTRLVTPNHDWDFLIGTWFEDPELEKSLADQRQIDEDQWK